MATVRGVGAAEIRLCRHGHTKGVEVWTWVVAQVVANGFCKESARLQCIAIVIELVELREWLTISLEAAVHFSMIELKC